MTQCNPTRFSETRNKPTASQTLFYTFISGIYTYLPFVSCWKPLCFYVFCFFLPESSILTSSDKNHAVKILVEFIKHHKRPHRSRLGFSLVVTQNGPQFRRQRLGQAYGRCSLSFPESDQLLFCVSIRDLASLVPIFSIFHYTSFCFVFILFFVFIVLLCVWLCSLSLAFCQTNVLI